MATGTISTNRQNFIIPVNGMFNLVPIWGCPQKINGRNAFILWSVTNTQFWGRTLLDALATNPNGPSPARAEYRMKLYLQLLGAVEDEWENHVRY